MASLYELTQNEIELIELVLTGEIDEQAYYDTLEAMGTEEKLQSYVKYIRNLKSEAEMFKTEKQVLENKQKQCEQKAERLMQSLTDYMNLTGKKKANAGMFSLTMVNHDTTVYDEGTIPEKYFEKVLKLNKTAIKEALKSGSVKGVTVENRPYLKII